MTNSEGSTMTSVVETAAPAAELNLTDRCDACGSAAQSSWSGIINAKNTKLGLVDGLLMFCLHHTAKYTANLEKQGFTMTIDQRPALIAAEAGQRDAGGAKL